jgi:hypothetical protein
MKSRALTVENFTEVMAESRLAGCRVTQVLFAQDLGWYLVFDWHTLAAREENADLQTLPHDDQSRAEPTAAENLEMLVSSRHIPARGTSKRVLSARATSRRRWHHQSIL